MRSLLLVVVFCVELYACETKTRVSERITLPDQYAADTLSARVPEQASENAHTDSLSTTPTEGIPLAFQDLSKEKIELHDCGDRYKSKKSKALIFVSSASLFAVIKVNGKLERLEKDPNNEAVSSKKDFIHIYENKEYMLIQKVHETGLYEDGAYYEGTLELQKGSEKIIVPIKGSTGC